MSKVTPARGSVPVLRGRAFPSPRIVPRSRLHEVRFRCCEGEGGEVLEDATFHGAAGRRGGRGEGNRKVEQAETKKPQGQA